jgi:hypothetical protein
MNILPLICIYEYKTRYQDFDTLNITNGQFQLYRLNFDLGKKNKIHHQSPQLERA